MKLKTVNTLIALLLLVFCSTLSFSQTRKELENKKKKTQNDIAYTNKLLREIKANSANSYNKLLLLNRKISLRKQLINNISNEIKMIDTRINETQQIVNSLEKDLLKLKKEYAKMIYYAYKNRSSYNRLMFILAAEDFNTAYKRLKYLQYYAKFRKKQSEMIVKTQEMLQNKLDDLRLKKQEKEKLINSQQEETVVLSLEKTEQSHVLTDLKSKEAELKKQLAQKRRAAVKIEKAIQKIIEEEAKKAAEAARAKAKPGEFSLTPEEKLISDNFGANMGRLPWPTERGEIVGTFGEHEHPVIPGIKVRNNGIDISTHKGALARAIFEGEVSQVMDIPGANKVVIVRHGNYLTVYQNLDEVFVMKGDKIKAKQNIGKIHTKATDHTTTIHLEIWKETNKMNPSSWLSHK